MDDDLEELQRLAQLLDEGKISVDEYERLRTELFSDGPSSGDQAGSEKRTQPPGWYSHPSGRFSHEAYWDGQEWTGNTRPGSGQTPKSSKVAVWVSVAVVAGIFGVALLALIAVQLAGSEVSQTFSEIGSSLDESESMSYGSDPDLDMLYDGCSEGSNADCDMLWDTSPFDSEYESLAIVCGGRTAPIEQGAVTCIATLETYSEVAALKTQCVGGFFPACDALFYMSESGSDDEALAVNCGGRNPSDSEETSCWIQYGFGSRD